MKQLILAIALVLGFASASAAQSVITGPVTSYKVAWEAGDNWADLGVQGFKIQVDNEQAIDLFQIVPDQNGTYTTPVPAMTPGTHVLAVFAYNADGNGDAATIVVKLVIFLDKAKNLRIIQVVQ